MNRKGHGGSILIILFILSEKIVGRQPVRSGLDRCAVDQPRLANSLGWSAAR